MHDICEIISAYNLIPIGIQGGNTDLIEQAQAKGLPVLNASSTHDKEIISNTKEPMATEIMPTKFITTPVRSGQQVVSKGGDLIVSAAVSAGAELLADGHIHVYGALRGRALAGISGDKTARIFCQSLEAELVSIAGFYRLSDAIQPCDQPCQIYLQGEHIIIEPL